MKAGLHLGQGTSLENKYDFFISSPQTSTQKRIFSSSWKGEHGIVSVHDWFEPNLQTKHNFHLLLLFHLQQPVNTRLHYKPALWGHAHLL